MQVHKRDAYLRIFVEDSFDSAHLLPNVPTGTCKHLHGHTYKIRLELEGDPGEETGWVIDYAEVKVHWDKVKVQVDHKYLNDIPGLENSTCENLAIWIARQLKPLLPILVKIEVRETEHCGVVLDLLDWH